MRYQAYLVFSLSVSLYAWISHVRTYFFPLGQSEIQVLAVLTALVCTPLVLLFIQKKKDKKKIEDTWEAFWGDALSHCPRNVWGLMTLGFVLFITTFVRRFFSEKNLNEELLSSFFAIFSVAALSYSITLLRKTDQGGIVNDGAAPHRD